MAEKKQPATLLGIGQCVVRGCTSTKARFTLSAADLAVCTDKGKGGCQAQCFARDEESDELFRDCLKGTPAAPPASTPPASPPVPAADAAPAASTTTENNDEVQPADPPARRKSGLLLGW